MKFHTWRNLWLNLAIAEKELGLSISDAAIKEMKQSQFEPALDGAIRIRSRAQASVTYRLE